MNKVYVRWYDHCRYENEWMNKEDVTDNPKRICETLGFLVHDRNDALIIAQTIDEETGMVLGVMVILKSLIIEYLDATVNR